MNELIDDAVLPERDRALVLANRAQLRLPAGDIAGAVELAETARSVGDRSGAGLAACLALYVLSLVADLAGRWEEAARLHGEAAALQSRDPEARLWPFRLGAIALLHLDRLDEGERDVRDGRRMAEEVGNVWGLALYQAVAAWRHFYAGAWDEAVTEAETGLRIADEWGSRAGVVLCQGILAHIAIRRGQPEAAERALAAVDEELGTSGPIQYQLHYAMWARALISEARDGPATASGMLEGVAELLAAFGWEGEFRDLGPDIVRLAVAAGNTARAIAVTETIERLAARERVPTATGAALRCRGLLEDDPETLTRAADAYRDGPRPYELALACEDAGAALARAGNRGDGARLLEEATTTYERLGADVDLARTATRLRELGIRRGRRGARRRPSTGWESLTTTEEKVARLASEGLTNPDIAARLYLSRHTVATHLAHVYAKLGIRSRVDLARMSAERAKGGPAGG